MAFVVTKKKWLTTESARVAAILLAPKFWDVKWTHSKLKKALSDIGLEYSAADIDLLNTELHTQGIVEDVPDIAPGPGPVPIAE